ncbi:MAG: hypothetical protein HQ567_12190 [Candidatus Nealsonbacteria bacterium]|nr:hypothetical protein [Candidatus Nealsonbacteria bacterium]
MPRTLLRSLRTAVVATLITSTAALNAAGPAVPFPEALDAAAVSVDRLDSILDYALILGNGDVNALLYSEGGQLRMMLTKNDVWDARLDSKLDPPLPTLKLIRRLAAESQPAHGGSTSVLEEGWGHRGTDSYHAHPYPCPRACARLVLADRPAGQVWRQIRAGGTRDAWQHRDGTAAMSVEGAAGASNGYAVGPLATTTDWYDRLRVKLAGSENAQYYIDVMDADGQVVFKTGWTETPTTATELVYELPPRRKIETLILYTWTEDGRRAENRFEKLVLEGSDASLPVDLSSVTVATSSAKLDLRRAVARVDGTPDRVPKADVRVLADRNVLLIRSPAPCQLLPTRSADTPEHNAGETDGVAWLSQAIPGDLDWPGMSFAVAVAGNDELKAVAVVTSREAKDPVVAAVALARNTLAAEELELIRRHESVWNTFWSASGVQLGDELLRDLWYRNLYFLRCVSKPGSIPPGLFASLIHDRPAWHGDYHTNYNIQQTFWTAYVTNYAELAEPYDRLIREYLPRARWLARQVFEMDGAYFPHVLFAYEPPDPQRCKSPVGRQYIHHVWGFTQGVNAFSVQPLWWHYKYAPDREFLARTAYPAVRDVAVFQAEFMDQCEGDKYVVLAPSVSPEHWGWTKDFARNRNGTFDVAMFRYVFEAAVEGATTLDCDRELVQRWQAALRRLPPYPTTPGDEPVVVDVQDAPPINYNIAVPAVPVFPGDVVTWFSPPAEKELFARSIERLQWNGNNSSIILSVARARLSMPDALSWMREELKSRSRPNGTLTLNRLGSGINTYGHYTEQFAASMAVSELLLQSVGDVIRVFPAWPKELDASFRDLRAQGGFLVAARQTGGEIVELTVTSTIGGRLRLVSPWVTIALTRADGRVVALKPDARRIVQCDSQSGEQIRFMYAEP